MYCGVFVLVHVYHICAILMRTLQYDISCTYWSYRFTDIVELTEAKRLLIEAVQLPIKYPSVFTGTGCCIVYY